MTASLPPGVWYAAELILLAAVLALLVLLGGCVTIVEQRPLDRVQAEPAREPVIFDQWGRRLVPLPAK